MATKDMILGFKKTFNNKPTNFKEKILDGRKIHTIRIDKNNRWQSGKTIHFAYDTRTKNYDCFKIGQCISVQEIEILFDGSINVDGYALDRGDIKTLIKNDGFDNLMDFFYWFSEYGSTFKGKIIHWTNKRI